MPQDSDKPPSCVQSTQIHRSQCRHTIRKLEHSARSETWSILLGKKNPEIQEHSLTTVNKHRFR